jgi:hypothetical protein
MKFSCLAFMILFLVPFVVNAQKEVSKLRIIGSDHLDNVYKKDKPSTDILSSMNQNDLLKFIAFVDPYKPNMICPKKEEFNSLLLLVLYLATYLFKNPVY